jgi:hypothetical protein
VAKHNPKATHAMNVSGFAVTRRTGNQSKLLPRLIEDANDNQHPPPPVMEDLQICRRLSRNVFSFG